MQEKKYKSKGLWSEKTDRRAGVQRHVHHEEVGPNNSVLVRIYWGW